MTRTARRRARGALLAAAVIVGSALAAVPPAPASVPGTNDPSPSPSTPLVRRDVKDLDAGERAAYVRAVKALKAAPSPYDPGLSYYDQFVAWHLTLYRCAGQEHDIHAGHVGPFFLPWHRAFVRLFEQALAEVSGTPIAVPYWDWTDAASTAAVFQDDFMGGDGDPTEDFAVTTGPFRKGEWELELPAEGLLATGSFQPHVVRRFGSGLNSGLPTAADVEWAMQAPAYDTAPYDMTPDPNVSFRNALEGWWRADPLGRRIADPIDGNHCGPDARLLPSRDGGKLHNQVHTYVGGIIASPTGSKTFGTMLLPSSPSDPVFFLHHSNVDRLWAEWQGQPGDRSFQPAARAGDLMEPFLADGERFSPSSVDDIGALGYAYDDQPAPATPAAATNATAATVGRGDVADVVEHPVSCPIREQTAAA